MFRSTGVKYAGMQFGPSIAPSNRSPTKKGNGVGHVYMHDANEDPMTGKSAPMSKSAYQNHTVMVAVLVEVLSSVKGKNALQWLDDNPGSKDGKWLHGRSGLPVTGNWYGYSQGSDILRKIRKVSINIRSHGSALFVTSTYPEAFQT